MESEFPFLPEEVNELLRDRRRLLLFMPSRLSDRWKGTDLFWSAYLETVKKFPDRFLLITSGWGQDYPKYQELLRSDERRAAPFIA